MSPRVARVALPGVGDDAHGWAADGLSASRWHGGRGLALTWQDVTVLVLQDVTVFKEYHNDN